MSDLTELTNDVIKNSDLVKTISSYMKLTKKGKDYWGICPFHDDSNPSLSVSPTKGVFTCWSCGVSGSAITFVRRFEHISYMEALRKVAEINGYSDPRLEKIVKPKAPTDARKEAMLKCLSDLTLYYQYALNTEEGKEGLDYFNERHLDEGIRRKYKLGYAFKDGKATCNFLQSKGHSFNTMEEIGVATLISGSFTDKNQGRVIFPVCDAYGNAIGYSARRIKNTDEAKYINSPETYVFHKSSVLYNYHIAKESAKHDEFIYVCEGFMDVFALSKIGIDSAVALMGTALTKEHVALLRSLNVEIRLCLDGDLPGQTAMLKASKLLADEGLNVSIVNNQNSPKDPDEILNQDGPEALRMYVNNLINRIDFALNYYKNSNPLKTMEQRKALVKNFIPILVNIESRLELDSYLRKLANVTGFEVESIRELLKNAKSEEYIANPSKVIASFHPERKALRRLELAERELLFQMLQEPKAIAFYEDKVGSFYDEVYRQVANYIVDYSKINDNFKIVDLISSLEISELDNKDEMIQELTELSYEDTHNANCSDELLDNLLTSIEEEKEKIFEKDMLQQSIAGKDPLEKARIMAEYNRRKMRKLNDKKKEK